MWRARTRLLDPSAMSVRSRTVTLDRGVSHAILTDHGQFAGVLRS
jgi:hypothetical protein